MTKWKRTFLAAGPTILGRPPGEQPSGRQFNCRPNAADHRVNGTPCRTGARAAELGLIAVRFKSCKIAGVMSKFF